MHNLKLAKSVRQEMTRDDGLNDDYVDKVSDVKEDCHDSHSN